MDRPVKGLFSKLRRQREPEPEPELAPDRLAALRHRAAVAEDPEMAEFDPSTESAEVRQARGLQPIVLVRAVRAADGNWSAGASWFGGLPKLGAIAWPRGADGHPLPFAAQIELAEVAELRPESPLPASGSLAFFLGEGAVIHVPAGVTQFSLPPEGEAPAQFAYWPVEPLALTLPPELRDYCDEARHDAIRAAMDAALAGEVSHPAQPFDAGALPEENWGGPIPVWWAGVDFTIDQLRAAFEQTESSKRGGLAALIGALEGFAAERTPWTRLNAEEREVFGEALANAWQQFGDLLHTPTPRDLADLATLSVHAMLTGDDEAFAALPAGVRERIDRDHRLPVHGLPQMLGLGMSTLPADPADVLLLQLPDDDMMAWGADRQFCIAPDALAERRWAEAKST